MLVLLQFELVLHHRNCLYTNMSNSEKTEENSPEDLSLAGHNPEESEKPADKMDDNDNKTVEQLKEKESQEVSKPMGDPENYIKHPLQNR